ncbi:sialate O-acetylesterase [Paenibacillus koleovorans]|uniref:sialate O-acetylesterase n=1 Tax=Paenibacillus koleovorans TaxID=121608 RepID=UPI000FDC924D|nr:sialate O-acetylesterase [Paenibacillus koleovorans]
MNRNPLGVIITLGPQSWAVVQHENGYGSISLAGRWSPVDQEEPEEPMVYVRIVRENDGGTIVPWQRCDEMLPERGWRTELRGIPVGGLYRIETSLQPDNRVKDNTWALRGDMVHHVAVGDLYVIAGQSNAAGYGRGPHNDAPELGIHLLRHSGRWDLATHPFNESTNSVHPLNRETPNPGHSPYLAFAKQVKRETGMPIGLLVTALGGSPLRRWNTEEEGDLYDNMLRIIGAAGGKVRGMLWYQGETDCMKTDCSQTYYARFVRTVERMRCDLGDTLPIFTVQLNRYTGAPGTDEDDRAWGRVREAQRHVAASIDRIYVVPALDCMLSDPIHNGPEGNMVLGERLANAALAAVYGRHVSHRAPDIAEATYGETDREGLHTIRLRFANVGGCLQLIGAQQERVFTVDDEQGAVEVKRWQMIGRDEIELTLGRETVGAAYVNAAYEANPPVTKLPVDTATYLPMLAFYGVAVR